MNDTVRGFAWTLLAVLLAVAIAVGGWAVYWRLAGSSQNHRYEVNTHSQQYQAGLESQARDDAQGFDIATDPGQRAQIRMRFCATYPQLTQPAADLTADAARIGC
jgi:hypothetical protein